MTDPAAPDLAPAKRDDGPLSTVAIISYLIILQFSMVAFGVFMLIAYAVKVDPAMLTVLGALVTCVVGGVGIVGGFWLAGAIGSKADRAALRQLAGAGPPPPADPTQPPPVPVEQLPAGPGSAP